MGVALPGEILIKQQQCPDARRHLQLEIGPFQRQWRGNVERHIAAPRLTDSLRDSDGALAEVGQVDVAGRYANQLNSRVRQTSAIA